MEQMYLMLIIPNPCLILRLEQLHISSRVLCFSMGRNIFTAQCDILLYEVSALMHAQIIKMSNCMLKVSSCRCKDLHSRTFLCWMLYESECRIVGGPLVFLSKITSLSWHSKNLQVPWIVSKAKLFYWTFGRGDMREVWSWLEYYTLLPRMECKYQKVLIFRWL